jgi:hypothetical protein
MNPAPHLRGLADTLARLRPDWNNPERYSWERVGDRSRRASGRPASEKSVVRGRSHVDDEIKKFAPDLINLERGMEVSSPDLGINFALSKERSIHPIPMHHRGSR